MVNEGFDFFEPRELNDVLEQKKVAQQWVANQSYDVYAAARKSSTPTETVVDIAQNAPYPVVKHFLKNDYTITPVLEAILLNESFNNVEVDKIVTHLVRHRNVTPKILEQIFVYIENATSYSALYYLVQHSKTPTHILVKFLPQNGAEKMFTYGEILGACNNINMPHAEALVASKLLHFKIDGEPVWNKHYIPFINDYNKNNGSNVQDWPEEWIAALIPGMKYPYPEQYE